MSDMGKAYKQAIHRKAYSSNHHIQEKMFRFINSQLNAKVNNERSYF